MYRLYFRRYASTFSLRYTTKNEPILEYRRGSEEIQQVQNVLDEYQSKVTRVPCIVDGKEIWTNDIQKQVLPFDHQHILAEYCYADKSLIQKAIDSAVKNQSKWDLMPIEQRANIFLKAADLAADYKWRSRLVATTMLGQGKTVFQAEIDAACELIDFWRFNVQHLASAMAYQPISTRDSENIYLHRGLEGFVAAVSPFNFTAIGGHLASAPALMGNTVLWKPSDTALLSNYLVYKILEEAGLPPGIIQFIPAKGEDFGRTITQSPDLAAITFTGSTKTFKVSDRYTISLSNFSLQCL
jgi:1-pyrroline-5-carboxylate dehydrogenase